MLKKLLITETPYEDESLDSYILRLTEANSYTTPDWIRRMVGAAPVYRMQFSNDEQLKGLSELSGISEVVLKQMSLSFNDGEGAVKQVKFMGQLVPIYLVNRGTARYCPKCLQEKPVMLQIWDLHCYTACTKHGNYLLDKCPSCGSKISWSRTGVCSCSCGADLRDAETEATADIVVSSLIKDKLLPQGESGNSDRIPLTLPLFSILRLLAAFTGLLRGYIDTTGKVLAGYRDIHYMNTEMAEAYKLFENWPINFYKCLDIQLNDPIKGQLYFKSLCRVLKRDYSYGSENFVYNSFIQYVVEHWKGGYVSRIRSFDKEVRMNRRYLSMADVRKILNARPETVERLIKEGNLEGKIIDVGSRKQILVNRDSVEILQKKMKSAISLKEASYLLDIGHESVVELVRKGYLTALVRPSDGQASWVINLDSINALLNNIENSLLYNKGKTLDFYYLLRRLSASSMTITDVLESILAKKLSPVALCPAIGFSKFLFLEDDIDNILDTRRNEKRENMLTVLDIADSLHVKQEVVAFWIDRGIILADNVIDGDKRKRLVLPTELEKFNNQYVTGSQLAKVYYISPKKLILNLKEQGIIPISGPTIDGGRQYLFYRKHISE